MLGNLSKVLIKAPGFFNNNIQTYNSKESKNIIIEENVLNPFNSINIISKRGNNQNSIYFREKDFWKKNNIPEMNFNNNKRLLYNLNIASLKSLKYDSQNNQSKKRLSNNFIKNKERYTGNDSPISTNGVIRNKNRNKYISSLLKSDIRLRTDSNRNIKYRQNIFNNSIHKKINVDLNRYDDEKSEIEDGKNNNTSNLEKSHKFPKIQNVFKSQESLFQDNADKKFTSLISVKPQIKEQLKAKNRCMVGKREFLNFKNSRKIDAYNPFYESIKIKEEMNNILK
jgi:hypothetical protein